MAKLKVPNTPATRVLKNAKISYSVHFYAYEEHGGTSVSARELGVDEHSVIKTLVMEDEQKNPLIVLMHGDLEVSTKQLARALKVKCLVPCRPEVAMKHSGYLVGGTSPFGTRKPLPIYMESSIRNLPKIYLNGGKRGFLVGLDPQVVVDLLDVTFVEAGI